MKARASWTDVGLAVAFNVLPIVGVLFWGWSPFALIFLYWLENVAIGGRTLLSILASGFAKGPGGGVLGVGLGAFFTVHYGLFCFVHGVFVVTLFGGEMGDGFDLVATAQRLLAHNTNLAIGFAAIVLWQAIELVLYLVSGRAREDTPRELMQAPYGRIVLLHVTILFGGFLLMLLGWPIIGVVALALFKTAYDVAVARGWRWGREAPAQPG